MLDDLWMILIRILLYPLELVARLWFALIELLFDLVCNIAPDVMPSLPDAPPAISLPRIGMACAFCLIALSIVNGALAAAVWLGLLNILLAYLVGGLISLALFGGTIKTLFRLIFDPPRARPRKARAAEPKPPRP